MLDIKPYEHARVANSDPFSSLEELQRRFFENPFGIFGTHSAYRTDITDLGDAYLLETDLPGFERRDIHLDVTGDVLRVCAERRDARREEDETHRRIRSERSYGSYRQEFDLSNINVDNIHARYENGVLTLTLPKKQAQLPETRSLELE